MRPWTPRIVLGTHYDTIALKRAEFVGANDGGSGCGVLLELARVLGASPPVELVFFDGEEALAGEADRVGLYGSRHHARQAPSDLRAVIVIDMVGIRLCACATSSTRRPGCAILCAPL